MALGKIKADTLEHSTAGSLDTQYVVNGSAKAWVFFDTDTGADINGSLNVSSLTDENLGRTAGSWTSSFGNANYSGVPHGPAGGTGHTTFGTQVTTIFGSRTWTCTHSAAKLPSLPTISMCAACWAAMRSTSLLAKSLRSTWSRHGGC